VINQIEVRQKLAPTLVLGAALPIAPLYRAGRTDPHHRSAVRLHRALKLPIL